GYRRIRAVRVQIERGGRRVGSTLHGAAQETLAGLGGRIRSSSDFRAARPCAAAIRKSAAQNINGGRNSARIAAFAFAHFRPHGKLRRDPWTAANCEQSSTLAVVGLCTASLCRTSFSDR